MGMNGLPERIPTVKKEDFFNSKEVHKERLVINGAQVDTVDVKPENLKSEVPVLVVPGWGATMENFKPGIKVLADKNRRVISLDQPRRGGTVPRLENQEIKDWHNEKGENHPQWSDEEFRKANTILGILDQKGLEKVDVIAHSEGAINICMAAMLKPEKFQGRTIILYSPAGLIGEDNILRLQKGAAANKPRTETTSSIPETEEEKEYLESTKHITPDYMKANPLRMTKELLAISRAQIEDMVKYLHEKGVKIVVVSAVDDTMFPAERMQKNVKSDNVPDGFVDGFLSVKGGHMQIQVHPEIFMSAIETLLPKEDKAKEKN